MRRSHTLSVPTRIHPSLACSATRAVCALAEARAHAVAAARSPAARAALLGDDEVQLWMEQLEDCMITIASNAGMYALCWGVWFLLPSLQRDLSL